MQTYVVFNDIADEHWSQKSRKIGKHICDAHQSPSEIWRDINVIAIDGIELKSVETHS